MTRIDRIVFDYGGVLTPRGRREFITGKLGGQSPELKGRIEAFFNSDFIREAACGHHDADEVSRRLAEVCGTDVAAVLAVLEQCCVPDAGMLDLVAELSSRYTLYLVSDSLPPFSDWIERELPDLFAAVFLSDRLGARKIAGLFDLANRRVPELFRNAVYVDDQAAHAEQPRVMGARTHTFRSLPELRVALAEEGVVLRSNPGPA